MSSDEGKKSIRSLFPFLDKWFVRYRMKIIVQGSKKIYRHNNRTYITKLGSNDKTHEFPCTCMYAHVVCTCRQRSFHAHLCVRLSAVDSAPGKSYYFLLHILRTTGKICMCITTRTLLDGHSIVYYKKVYHSRTTSKVLLGNGPLF